MFNVWRSIEEEPIRQMPLGLISGKVGDEEDPDESDPFRDKCIFEIHYKDRVGENWFAKDDGSHDWYYCPLMGRNEVLLFKQWDSWGMLALKAREEIQSMAKEREEREGKADTAYDAAVLDEAVQILKRDEKFSKFSRKIGNGSGNVGTNRNRNRCPTFCMHGALTDRNFRIPIGETKVPPRTSIEIRCFAFF